MPSAVFPRPSWLTLESVSAPGVPAGLRQITSAGSVQLRKGTVRGRSWTETYNPMFIGKQTTESWFAWLRWAWGEGKVFTIKHPTIPGSGLSPNGLGTAGVTVQTSSAGSSIVTQNWPTNTSNVVRAGDLISIAGVGPTLQITDDANSNASGYATLYFNPPIFTGNAPSVGAAVTTTDVTINAIISEEPDWPSVGNSFWYQGFKLTFRESP